MIKLKDTLDLTFMKFKVAPSHNDADYFKGFFLAGYEHGLAEIDQLKLQITRLEFSEEDSQQFSLKCKAEVDQLKERINRALEVASETYDSDLARCEAMIRALEEQND